MNRPTHPATAPQRGQSVVEFLVLSVALVPLFLLFPMIGRYQDIRHATQMASRYAAFDATTRNDIQSVDGWKPEAQLADEIRRRFFSNSDAPIKTNDVAGDFDANRNLAWRDPYNNPLITRFSDVSLSFGNGGSKHADGYSAASDSTPFNRVPVANAGAMGLQAPGIYTANVSVKLANLPAGIKSVVPFDTIDLSMQRHTSLLFEQWSSPSPQETENRFGNLAPVPNVLSAFEPIIAFGVDLVDMFKVSPPEFGKLEKWRDVVPQDRLKPVE
ncbi:MAG: hypothetical protein ACI9ZF_002926 [Bradyrhizobium sp.]|jgi:hypothetical protein